MSDTILEPQELRLKIWIHAGQATPGKVSHQRVSNFSLAAISQPDRVW